MKGFVSYILGLCQKKEGTEVEFKSALGGFPGSFWETYSAFVNTKESGQKSRLKSGQKIVELMRKNPSITIAELVAELGMSRSGVNKQIAKLKAEGVIEREGADKGGYWVVI